MLYTYIRPVRAVYTQVDYTVFGLLYIELN